MEDNRPVCDIKLNKDGSIPFESLSAFDQNCRIPKSVKGVIIPMDGERDTTDVKTTRTDKNTELPLEAITKKEEIAMSQNESAKSAEVQPTESPTTVATVGVDQAISQVKSLVPAGADASPALMIGGAAVLAVVGAAVKFGPTMLKSRAEKAERDHEAKMKQLEIEEKKAEKQEDQHQQCNISRAALEAKVVALTAQLEEMSSKVSKISSSTSMSFGDMEPDELVERIGKIEKALKTLKKPAKK